MVSVMWKSETSLHALDHQVNLDLDPMAFCIRKAFWNIGLGLSRRYARYLVNRMVAGM